MHSFKTNITPLNQEKPQAHQSKLNKQKILSSRPGRKLDRTNSDPQALKHYGTPITANHDKKQIRIFFQNIKGISYSPTGEDYDYLFSSLDSIAVDIAGFAETNTAWQHTHIRNDFKQRAHRFHNQSNIAHSIISKEIDNIPINESFQAGGTATMTLGKWTTMVHGPPIQDKTGLGRWSGITLRGKNATFLSIITAYRCCNGSIKNSPLGSTFTREFLFLQDMGEPKPNPRASFIKDLSVQIQELQSSQHLIILMIDANTIMNEDTKFQNFLSTFDLTDLHSSDPANSTYIGSPNRRIDYIFGSKEVTNHCPQTGTLSYTEGPQSDHRGLYIDIDPISMFGSAVESPPITSSITRALKSGNPESVECYNKEMMKYYKSHNMIRRIEDLYANHETIKEQDLRNLLEKWDNDQGRAMKHSESVMARPKQKYSWSPELRNAGLLRRYWKIRERQLKHNEDHTKKQSPKSNHRFNSMTPLSNFHSKTKNLNSKTSVNISLRRPKIFGRNKNNPLTSASKATPISWQNTTRTQTR
jgi:hypothetical protein